MSYFFIDVETDGPIPGDFSMISFGSVFLDQNLNKTFYGEMRPISENYYPEALKISRFTREETLRFEYPYIVMLRFREWILSNTKGRPLFISDNNGFDWMFMCWYFHHFLKDNPFGFSSMNLGSFYKGIVRDVYKNFKHLRTTIHTHHPVDDAMGNAEAFLKIVNENDVNIKF
jgi:hypothetical protein